MSPNAALLPLLLLFSACDTTSPAKVSPESKGASRPAIETASAPSQRADVDRSTEFESARYPEPLHGVWDVGPGPCDLTGGTESDSRFEITSNKLTGYEHFDVPRSVERVAGSTQTWRIVAVSNIAPPEVQQDAVPYTLDGNKLTIGEGQHARTYVRCTR